MNMTMNLPKTIVMLFASVLLLGACATQEERAARKAEQIKKVTAALNARDYMIDITRMIPSKGPARSVSVYSIEVRNDSLISHLPYIGRAYNVPYGGGNGLNFSALISSYKEKEKNGLREIEISVTNSEDSYLYVLNVFDNGSISLNVQSRQRELISYTGDMVFDQK
jgi:hypothetical protein